VKALVFRRKPVRFAAAVVAGRLAPGRGAGVGPLSLDDVDVPDLPGPDWVRVRPRLAGICGSDLATVDGSSSRWFEDIVSFPFVPGHEVVGDTDDGRRVVVVPILTCAVRGIDPPCSRCAAGRPNHCERVAFGCIEAGLQTGFCASTGGGWSTLLVAHARQLVEVPEALPDESAVLVEPMACAVHAARQVTGAGDVAVIGAGTLGLLTVAALRRLAPPAGSLIVTAKHPHQRRLARELGADVVAEPARLAGHVRAATGSWVYGDAELDGGLGTGTPTGRLTGGAAEVVDCVGNEASLTQALEVVAPGGTVHVVGMPATTTLDLTPLWYREVALRGCYAYDPDDFVTAIELVADLDLGRLVSATYPLSRYRDAIAHAAEAGRRGAVKIAFDLRAEKERTRL